MHNKEASKNKDERRMSSLDNIIHGHTSCHGHGHRGWSLIPNPNPNPRPSILISGRFIAISQKKKTELGWQINHGQSIAIQNCLEASILARILQLIVLTILLPHFFTVLLVAVS